MKKWILIFYFLFFSCIWLFSQNRIYSPEEYNKTVSSNVLRNEGQSFTIRGTVSSVWANWDNSIICVSFSTGSFYNLVSSFTYREVFDRLIDIWSGDVITFTGICKDEDSINSCKLENIEKKRSYEIKASYTLKDFVDTFNVNMLAPIGKTFEITGIVQSVNRSGSDYRVELHWVAGSIGISFYYANFGSDQREALIALDAGQSITFTGRVESVGRSMFGMSGINFVNCKINK